MMSHEDLMIPGLQSPTKSNRSSTNPFDNESMGDDPVSGVGHSELTDSVAESGEESDPITYSMRGGMMRGVVIDVEEEHRRTNEKDDVESGSQPPDSDYASRPPKSLWDPSIVMVGDKKKKPPTLAPPVRSNNDDTTHTGKRRKYLRILVGVAVVVFALAIAAAIYLLRNANEDEPDARQQALDQILNTLSTPESLADEESPQFRARQWLLHHDALQLNPLANATQESVTQRYSLATIYFSTGGDVTWNTSNWLNGGECDIEHWNFVDCNENQEIRAMVFGMCTVGKRLR
jgi:hypothetical protein